MLGPDVKTKLDRESSSLLIFWWLGEKWTWASHNDVQGAGIFGRLGGGADWSQLNNKPCLLLDVRNEIFVSKV